jgi:hypothetical protein
MNRTFLFLLLALTSGHVVSAQQPLPITPLGPQPITQIITADQVSGVYRSGENELRIQALDRNKIQFQFSSEWITSHSYPNVEKAVGEVIIEGNVARFITGDAKKCKISLTFLTNRLEVTREGAEAECGFKYNLVAGTYRRIKGGHARLVRIR